MKYFVAYDNNYILLSLEMDLSFLHFKAVRGLSILHQYPYIFTAVPDHMPVDNLSPLQFEAASVAIDIASTTQYYFSMSMCTCL